MELEKNQKENPKPVLVETEEVRDHAELMSSVPIGSGSVPVCLGSVPVEATYFMHIIFESINRAWKLAATSHLLH